MYIVTELLEGGELLDAMTNLGSYTEDEARLIMRQLLEGLQYMHKKGVTHRDLKGASFLFSTHSESYHAWQELRVVLARPCRGSAVVCCRPFSGGREAPSFWF